MSERDGEGCDECGYTTCRCNQKCDCCRACARQLGFLSCSALPEYNCPGQCIARGEPGHFKERPDGLEVDFPTRA